MLQHPKPTRTERGRQTRLRIIEAGRPVNVPKYSRPGGLILFHSHIISSLTLAHHHRVAPLASRDNASHSIENVLGGHVLRLAARRRSRECIVSSFGSQLLAAAEIRPKVRKRRYVQTMEMNAGGLFSFQVRVFANWTHESASARGNHTLHHSAVWIFAILSSGHASTRTVPSPGQKTQASTIVPQRKFQSRYRSSPTVPGFRTRVKKRSLRAEDAAAFAVDIDESLWRG